MENSEQIFAIALGLEKPWNIEKVTFSKDTSQFLKVKLNLPIFYFALFIFF